MFQVRTKAEDQGKSHTKLISSILLQNSTSCEDMKTRESENDFVLYNAYRSHGVENVFVHSTITGKGRIK